MRYTSPRFVFQPRPEDAISPGCFKFYEDRGWWGQAKKNGTANQTDVLPDGRLIWTTRHNTPHKLWSPTKKSSAQFERIAGTGIHKLVTELLHSKTKGGVKDTHFIHDILAYNGEFLYGWTYRDRVALLRDIFLKGDEEETVGHVVIDDHTWLAKNHVGPFESFKASLKSLEDEGIVLKNPDAELAICSRPGANSFWQRKSRHPTKNAHT